MKNQISFYGVLRSEWIKIHSLKSNRILLILAPVLAIAFSALYAFILNSMDLSVGESLMASESAPDNLWDLALSGTDFLSVCLAILAILAITNEYSSLTILPSLIAVPKRGMLFAAKAVILIITTAVVSFTAFILSGVSTYFIGRNLYEYNFMTTFVDQFSTHVPNALLATILLILFTLGLGFTLRSSIGAILVYIGVWEILPPSLLGIAAIGHIDVLAPIYKVLPSSCYTAFMTNVQISTETSLTATLGLIGLIAWVIASLGVGLTLFLNRDA